MSGNMTRQSQGPSWGIIVLLLLIFWPLGLYLLIRKLNVDKRAALKSSTAFSVIGYCMLAIGVVVFFACIDGGFAGSAVSNILFFGVGGYMLVRYAQRMKKRGDRYKRYITLVVNQRMESIAAIASVMSINYNEVVKDLQSMIDIGYFDNACIDVVTGKFVLQAGAAAHKQKAPLTPSVVASKNKMVTCASCGANNIFLDGAAHECEYCGSPLV